MTSQLWQAQRMTGWVSFVAAQLGMNGHPGTTRDKASPKSRDEILAEADFYLSEQDKRFPASLFEEG